MSHLISEANNIINFMLLIRRLIIGINYTNISCVFRAKGDFYW